MSCKIVAFYGYKGGAGRSWLAANVAATLALAGRKTLLMDWDLEAPGAGDFLDMPRSDRVPEKWRQNSGIFDLLAECNKAGRRDLMPIVSRYLDPQSSEAIVRGGRVRPDLLGPGRQISADPEAVEFGSNLIATDWIDFFASFADRLRAAFNSAIEKSGYETVVIDTRTGFNLPTLFVLRYLAQKVFFVSPKTYQSLEGIWRMWNLLPDIEDAPNEYPERRLVLSRYRLSDKDAEADYEGDDSFQFIKYFGENAPHYWFPHLKAIRDTEQLLFENEELRKVFFGPQSSLVDTEIRVASENFGKLCIEIGDIDIADEKYRSLRDVSRGFRDLTGIADQKTVPPIDGEGLAREVIRLTKEAAPDRMYPTSPADKSVRASTDNDVTASLTEASVRLGQWLDRASLFSRMALGVYTGRLLSENLLTKADLPSAIGERLRIDLDRDPASLAVGREMARKLVLTVGERQQLNLPAAGPATSDSDTFNKRLFDTHQKLVAWLDHASTSNIARLKLSVEILLAAQGLTAEDLPGDIRERLRPDLSESYGKKDFFTEARSRATQLWRDAMRARNESDDPTSALKHLDNAIAVLNSIPLRGLNDGQIAQIVNDELIYRWEHAIALNYMTDSLAAVQEILDLLKRGLPETKEKDGTAAVCAPDLRVALLSFACEWIDETEKPLDQERLDEIVRVVAELENQIDQTWSAEEERTRARRAVAEFRVRVSMAAVNRNGEGLVAVVNSFATSCETYLAAVRQPESGATLEALSACARSDALLTRILNNADCGRRIYERLKLGRDLVDRYVSEPSDRLPLTEIISLGDVASLCERPLETFEVFQDVLQMVEAGSDTGTARTRHVILRNIVLAQNALGRPDLARGTWKELWDATSRIDPNKAPWWAKRYRTDAVWWEATFCYEMGEFEDAWTGLRKYESDYEEALSRASNPRQTDGERSCLRDDLRRIRAFLSPLALTQKNYAEAKRYARIWESNLSNFDFLNGALTRRQAMCRHVLAQAYYCSGDEEIGLALTSIPDALERNQSSADAYGWTSAIIQAELLILGAEIQAFHSGTASIASLEEALKYIENSGAVIINPKTPQGWFYTFRIRIATAAATVAAVYLRIGEVKGSVACANNALRWLAFTPEVRRNDSTKWVLELARLPTALAASVLSKLGSDTRPSLSGDAVVAWKSLREAHKHRYRRIFEFCGISGE